MFELVFGVFFDYRYLYIILRYYLRGKPQLQFISGECRSQDEKEKVEALDDIVTINGVKYKRMD